MDDWNGTERAHALTVGRFEVMELVRSLKPCPFCGSEPEMDTQRAFRAFDDGRISHQCAIYCTACDVDMSVCYRDLPARQTEDVVVHLTERWNARAESAERSLSDMRERAAKVADLYAEDNPFDDMRFTTADVGTASKIAAAIRSLNLESEGKP